MEQIVKSELPYATLDELLITDNMGKHFKLRARVTNISKPTIHINQTETQDGESPVKTPLPLYSITLQDETGARFTTGFFYDETKLQTLKQDLRDPRYRDFVVKLSITYKMRDYSIQTRNRGNFTLHILDILDADTPLQVIQANTAEQFAIEQKIQQLNASGMSVREYMKDTLVRELGIRKLDEFPALERALDGAIIQAFSYGMIQQNSGKLHSLLIGPPGVGKKLIALSASAINLTARNADPMKITTAGVVGSAKQQKQGWTSEPGLLPLSNHGIFIMQDFHAVSKRVKQELYGAFSMMMEDGEVTDATSAKITHTALASLHLDLNKLSDIYLEETHQFTPQQRLADIQLPVNIVTRFDMIFELDRDAQRQFTIANDMLSQPPTIRMSKETTKDQWKRELQVMVAYLIEQFFEPDIPDSIREYIREKQSALFSANKDIIEKLTVIGDYQTRFANSIVKLVIAIARMNQHGQVLREDVDVAYEYVAPKFEFLKTFMSHLAVPADWANPDTYNIYDPADRRRFISDHFQEEIFTFQDVKALLEEQFGNVVSDRQLRRDVKTLAEIEKKDGTTIQYKIKS